MRAMLPGKQGIRGSSDTLHAWARFNPERDKRYSTIVLMSAFHSLQTFRSSLVRESEAEGDS